MPNSGYFLILYHSHLLSGTWFYNSFLPSETPLSFGFFEEGLSCSQWPFSSSPAFPFFPTASPWVPTEALSHVLLYTRSCQPHSSNVTSTQMTPKSAFLELPFSLLTFKPTFNFLVEPPASQRTKNLGNGESRTSPGWGRRYCIWEQAPLSICAEVTLEGTWTLRVHGCTKCAVPEKTVKQRTRNLFINIPEP